MYYSTSIKVASCLLLPSFLWAALPDGRPSYDARSYHSSSIDNLISTLQPLFNNPDLATLFSNCLPNTLDTTVYYTTPSPSSVSSQDLDSFVITGDINAMWLRDSMNQVLPYVPYAAEDSALQYLIEGLINRQAKSILIDSFANAFNFNASGDGHQDDQRRPPMTPSVFEGKYEIDSLNAFFKLSYWYWQYTSDDALVRVASETWLNAVDKTLQTIATMQKDTGRLDIAPYLFRRTTSEALDTLIIQGRGPPCQPNGMTRSLFRPSDDAVTHSYNIAGNAMACVELHHVSDLLARLLTVQSTVNKDTVQSLLDTSKTMQSSLCNAVNKYTTSSPHAPPSTTHYHHNPAPYEVDGLGAAYFMDDANIPSLLSLPILGYMSKEHPAYQVTRKFVLSEGNPFYFAGDFGKGIGGPHEGYNLTWPMAITVQAMTSADEKEIKDCLDMLLTTTANTGFMHEAFDVNDPRHFTRTWFAWANGLFGEMILQLIVTNPSAVIKNDPDSIALAQSLVKEPVSLRAQKQALIA